MSKTTSIVRNPEKKYPIRPGQIISEREGCPFGKKNGSRYMTSSNLDKCYHCGIYSENFTTGLMIGLFESTKWPMAIVERVACNTLSAEGICIDEDNQNQKGYYARGEKVYHILNAVDMCIKDPSNSICYKWRGCNDDVNKRCNNCDIDHAANVMDAILGENDLDSTITEGEFRKKVRDGDDIHFTYYSYQCPTAGLTEVLIPIYLRYNEPTTIVGVLAIGQIPIENEMSKRIVQEVGAVSAKKTRDKDEKQYKNMTDEAFQKEVWCSDRKTYKSLNDFFSDAADKRKPIGREADVFLDQMMINTTMSENNYLHSFQSALIQDFFHFAEVQKDEEGNVEKLISKTKNMFKMVLSEFDIDRIYLFFPDINLSDDVYNPKITGINIHELQEGELPLVVDIDNFPTQGYYKTDVNKIIEADCLGTMSTEGEWASGLIPGLAENGYYEFYKSESGSGTAKTFFGLFIEWKDAPKKTGGDCVAHEGFFTALMGVCASEIMSQVNQSRNRRMQAFAEETRHDLSQRIQTLESHNDSFNYDCRNYFEGRNGMRISGNTFQEFCNTYLNANRELNLTLNFLRDTLDDTDLRYSFKPRVFNPYLEFFTQMKQHYNAPWHPLNQGRRLHITPYDEKMPYPHVFVDETMFRRIMMNLLDNAFKYSPGGTNVYIDVRHDKEEQTFIFDVINIGFGIEQWQKDKIFERGKREHRIAAKGKGLGLAIARDFAKKHGGHIDITSGIIPAPGEGAEQEDTGVVANVNVTLYHKLKKMVDDGFAKPRIVELYELVSKKVRGLQDSYSDYYELIDRFGRRNLYDFIMSDPDGKAARSIDKTQTGVREMERFVNKKLYLIKFSLILPDSRRNRNV